MLLRFQQKRHFKWKSISTRYLYMINSLPTLNFLLFFRVNIDTFAREQEIPLLLFFCFIKVQQNMEWIMIQIDGSKLDILQEISWKHWIIIMNICLWCSYYLFLQNVTLLKEGNVNQTSLLFNALSIMESFHLDNTVI